VSRERHAGDAPGTLAGRQDLVASSFKLMIVVPATKYVQEYYQIKILIDQDVAIQVD
jgi:hypothetical protein